MHLNAAVNENLVLKNVEVIDRTKSTKMYSVQFGAKAKYHIDGGTIPSSIKQYENHFIHLLICHI